MPWSSWSLSSSAACSGLSSLLAAEQLVEVVGPLVQLLLERLEHLDLGGGRDAVAAALRPPPPAPLPPPLLLLAAASWPCRA